MIESTKGSVSVRSASGSNGLPPSLSRNLGRELARRLQEASADEKGNETEVEDTGKEDENVDHYEEEIVMTRRRLVSSTMPFIPAFAVLNDFACLEETPHQEGSFDRPEFS